VRQQQDGRSRIPVGVLAGHAVLAAALLVVWVAYLATDDDALRWVALAGLVVVAGLDFTMFARWLPQVRQSASGPQAARRASGGTRLADRSAEATFPVPVVVAHGLLGAVTLVLVLLTALSS
jgi:hypothetical protein